MNMRILATLAAGSMLAACGNNAADNPIESTSPSQISVVNGETMGTFDLKNRAGETIGKIVVSGSDTGGVNYVVAAEGIPEGAHGMHFHEIANCTAPDFKSAGGHINPMKKQHGLENPAGPDNADMPNLISKSLEVVLLEGVNPRVSMTGGGGLPALLDNDGSALVIHESPDDQVTQPIGGAGARIACAEIRR